MAVEQPSTKPAPSKGTALVLEVLPAILGIFGVGWIYSGRTQTGVILLISGFVFIWGGYIAIFLGSTAFSAITFGLGSIAYCLVCLVPFIQVIAAAASTLALNSELSK